MYFYPTEAAANEEGLNPVHEVQVQVTNSGKQWNQRLNDT